MFTTILWATDGSENADRALAYATQLARDSGATLHAAHIVQRMVGGKSHGQFVTVNEESIDAKIEGQLAACDLDPEPVLHMLTSTANDTAKPIAALARECHADVIVVGTRGHSGLAGLALGSVTQRLLHVAPCPVLVVTPDSKPASDRDLASLTEVK